MKRKAVSRLKLSSFIMTAYALFFFFYNYNYVASLNEYFGILAESSEMIGAVNASRAQMNADFVQAEVFLGIIGAVILLIEILCISSLISVYKELAYKDPLTGAWSRAALEEDFDQIETRKKCRKITYYLFDMNYLKQINDGYGHKVGDDFLIAMYGCIKTAFSGSGKVYRLAGDEFVAISKGNKAAVPGGLMEAVNKQVDNYNTKGNRTKVQLSFAKGYYSGEFDYDDPYFRDTLYTAADDAMYKEKEEFHRVHPRNERIDRVTKEVVVRKI